MGAENGEGISQRKKEVAVVVLTSQRKKITVFPEKLLPRDTDEDLGGGHVDDMTKLTYLNEPGVLYNLKRRYAARIHRFKATDEAPSLLLLVKKLNRIGNLD